jgi:hypothetical protein
MVLVVIPIKVKVKRGTYLQKTAKKMIKKNWLYDPGRK